MIILIGTIKTGVNHVQIVFIVLFFFLFSSILFFYYYSVSAFCGE